ncbi:MAG: hypothetical protein IIX70_06115 [Oscillospiraceae bacterium]|nr:hypothetical protein [Oscillospiraceae bacterium]
MKRFLTMLLVLLLMGGCAAVPSSVPEEPARSGLEQTAIFFEGRVLYDLDGVLVLTEQIDWEEKGELLTFTLGDLPLTDENGKAADRTIQPGDTFPSLTTVRCWRSGRGCCRVPPRCRSSGTRRPWHPFTQSN